ncbi:MAG: DUF2075 domain-containing protein [Candidatus Zixiibacteriota bacterium]
MPKRAYFQADLEEFHRTNMEEIIGHLSLGSQRDVDQLQRNAWCEEINILKVSTQGHSGYILLEYTIPRMGRRADAVVLFANLVAVIEFKVGETNYSRYAIDQVYDYGLDLKNFHEQSHDKTIVPILVATKAPSHPLTIFTQPDGIVEPVLTNADGLASVLQKLQQDVRGRVVDPTVWIESRYRPTPTIIEAAQALYRGHDVQEISRSEAGAENLTRTTVAIDRIILESKSHSQKSICFVTGVPGAGKTLAGLNIANSWHDPANVEHAVFLSGNGPLVDVLREALARDEVQRAKWLGESITKSAAISRVKAFIQNVHHFRDEALASSDPLIERVAIFDESQRAWDAEHTSAFMKKRKGVNDFTMSEPEFLISVMDRHRDWATIVCLIGDGQEINKGEAGLAEWLRVLHEYYGHWTVYISDILSDSDYVDQSIPIALSRIRRIRRSPDLHLSTSIRSFRAEGVSLFVRYLLDGDALNASDLLKEVLPKFPVVLTRDLSAAKRWIQEKARGNERFGIVASSEAVRLKPFGINVKAEIDPRHWFLNDKDDIRSSYYMEDVATEFQIQGLELDWICVAWDADLRRHGNRWEYHCFRGTRWQTIRRHANQKYLVNAYRVLLTRARQGMVIFIPEGSDDDPTRRPEFYDSTYKYLRGVGIPEISSAIPSLPRL